MRPQEAVAAVQALAQAYADYYGAVADANRAQFRLYRALRRPARPSSPSRARARATAAARPQKRGVPKAEVGDRGGPRVGLCDLCLPNASSRALRQ